MRPARNAAKPKPGSPVQVEIESIAAGGAGVGRLSDGRAVFVHRTAPGELVEAFLVQERPRWARARLLKVLRESPDRRPAPCPHYGECGGCTIEHLGYEAQLAAKARIVTDALERIGGLQIPPPLVTPSPNQFRYRNRVALALRRLPDGTVLAGFHSLHDPNRIVPIDGQCLLMEEPIGRAWDRLRESWGPSANLLPPGKQLRLTLRATSAGRVTLLIEGGLSPGRPADLVARVEELDSVWHRPDSEAARHVAGAPGLPETWGEEQFQVAGTAFLQVNREGAALLEDYVISLAGDLRGFRVIDAYCGIGLHARRLAKAGASVTGIELDPEAVRIAENAGTPNATFVCGAVENALAQSLPAHLLILNPPRAGVDSGVTDAIISSPPERIIYISCDPATLARDLKRLDGFYDIAALRCFDLFPQTAHIETVVMLTLSGTTAGPA